MDRSFDRMRLGAAAAVLIAGFGMGFEGRAQQSVAIPPSASDGVSNLVDASRDAGRGLADPSLATDPGGFAYWMSPHFLNLMKHSNIVTVVGEERLRGVDLLRTGFIGPNGYPDPAAARGGFFPEKVIYNLALHQGTDAIAAETEGTYRIRWRGRGTVTALGMQNVSQNRVLGADGFQIGSEIVGTWTGEKALRRVQIAGSDPNDPVRDLSVVRVEWADLFDVGAQFDPRLVRVVEDNHTLRFLAWLETNGSDVKTVDDIAPSDAASWALSKNWAPQPEISAERILTVGTQIPYDVPIALANQVGADPWLLLPLKADDAFVRAFAETLARELDPDRIARVELSNEVWNWSPAFDQTFEASALGPAGLDEVRMASARHYYGYRSAQIRAILEEVLDPSRFRLVMATQTAWLHVGTATEAGVLQYFADRGETGTMADVFDSLAITGYFDGINDKSMQPLRARWYAESEARFAAGETASKHAYFVERAADYMEHGVASLSDAERALPEEIAERRLNPLNGFHASVVERNAALARDWGLELVQYEADSHVSPKPFRKGGPDNEWLYALNRSDRMAALTRRMLDIFRTAGGTLANDFIAVGHADFGLWGTREHLTDENVLSRMYGTYNEEAAQRYGSINEGRAPDAFLHGVTTLGGDGAEQLVGTAKRDFLTGGPGSDVLVPGGGEDGVHGGLGIDLVVLEGAPEDYRFDRTELGFTVERVGSVDRMAGIELIAFAGSRTIHAASDLTGGPSNGPVDALFERFVQAFPGWSARS